MVYIVFAEQKHLNTGDRDMIKAGSLFSQALSLINRNDFSRAVKQWDAEKGAKGFRCWDQFVAMVFGQLAGADSLREIEGGLSTALGKLRHFLASKASPLVPMFRDIVMVAGVKRPDSSSP